MATPAYASLYRRSFDDPDHYQASVRGGDNLYSLLDRGEFRADLTSAEIGGFKLQRGRESLSRLAAWGTPANQIGVVLWPPRKGRLPVVRGTQIQPGELLVFGQNVQSYHRTFGPNQFITLMLNAAGLADALHNWSGQELDVTSVTVLRPPKEALVRLTSLAQSVLRIMNRMPALFSSVEVTKALEQSVLQSTLMCLQQGEARNEGIPRPSNAMLAKKLQEIIEANLDRPLHLPELCRMAGVPERALRKLFHEQMGMPPVRFLAVRRLHLAHRALLRADAHSTTVTEIATSLGIWEFGRFAVAYKSLFGESPSATMRRTPSA
jgi:AraC-like DNA-binding protein